MKMYGDKIDSYGFSGHHNGIAPDIAAYTIGFMQNLKSNANFNFIERHFTLDRTWKGTDHAASLEPEGLRRLNRDIKAVNVTLKNWDGKFVKSEQIQRNKLKKIKK